MLFSIRKIVVVFLIVFFSFLISANFSLAQQCPAGWVQVDDDCYRPLEVVYPKIGGEELTVEKVVKEGVPAYVKYIFNLSVGIIGLIVFGVLIYNGFLYLSSAGKPEQMTEARKGILAGFLGSLILLSSVLIFNTINPQLKIMQLKKIQPLESVVIPGVYICNYKVGGQKVTIDEKEVTIEDIGSILETYIDPGNQRTPEERIEAAKKLKTIMNINNQNELVCQRVNSSVNFQNFTVTNNNETIFIIPSISIDPNSNNRLVEFQYGIVLHEKDNFDGQCQYYPKEDENSNIYHQIDGYSAKDLPFTAHSVTLFQKPSTKPVGDGGTLYRCFNYNREGKCDEEDPPPAKSYLPKNDVMKIDSSTLESAKLKEKTRSISFSPPGSFLALLKEGEDFNGRCKVLYKNNPNLMDLPIGICPFSCKVPLLGWFFRVFTGEESCAPCLRSMIIIKGSVL